jgi:uncharacterized protein YbaP (TraB family)
MHLISPARRCRIAGLLLAALVAGPQAALARHAPAPHGTAPHGDAAAQARPALWKVARGGSTIWLMGTIHALPKGVAWFRGPIAQAFDGSGDLVTEIIETSPQDMQALVLAKAVLPEGQSLSALLPPADRDGLAKALAANGMAATALDRFRPWYAAVALSTLPLLKTGYDPAQGVDAVLAAKAVAPRGHEAFETPEFQLGLFASLPQDVQIDYLREVIKGLPTIRSELTGMIDAWERGQADRLAQIMNADQDSPQMRDLLLINRNKAWAAWIENRLAHPKAAGETIFVAVGAGHLAGPGSVQDQLTAAGVRVLRVQ